MLGSGLPLELHLVNPPYESQKSAGYLEGYSLKGKERVEAIFVECNFCVYGWVLSLKTHFLKYKNVLEDTCN